MQRFLRNARRTNPRTTSFVLTLFSIIAGFFLSFSTIHLYAWLTGMPLD